MTAPAQAQQGQQQQPAQPGQFFDIPGIPGGSSQFTEQDETTTSAVLTLSSSTQTQFQTIQSFRQTDVVENWWANISVAPTYTAGTSTLTASSYAPYNFVGPVQLSIQNQYASVDVESGIDLAIFSIIRPYSSPEILTGNNLYANPAGAPIGGTAQGYATTALAQPNLINGAQWSTASTSYNLQFRLPAAQWFDEYFDLALDGTVLSQAHRALVSPQYMAGTTRVVTPRITMNPLNASTTDLGPVNIGAGTGTATGTATARFRRKAVYASGNRSILPGVYAWQYRWKTTRVGLGAVSTKDVPVPLDSGQILSLYVRLFDPAAAGGLGAPISLASLTRFSVMFGSGLLAFDAQTNGGLSAGAMVQRRWLENHDTLLPPGVAAVDFALNERGALTNARALNVLTTSGIQVHCEFSGVQSASSYLVLGVESLVYVS